jgi:hypothetical protein
MRRLPSPQPLGNGHAPNEMLLRRQAEEPSNRKPTKGNKVTQQHPQPFHPPRTPAVRVKLVNKAIKKRHNRSRMRHSQGQPFPRRANSLQTEATRARVGGAPPTSLADCRGARRRNRPTHAGNSRLVHSVALDETSKPVIPMCFGPIPGVWSQQTNGRDEACRKRTELHTGAALRRRAPPSLTLGRAQIGNATRSLARLGMLFILFRGRRLCIVGLC